MTITTDRSENAMRNYAKLNVTVDGTRIPQAIIPTASAEASCARGSNFRTIELNMLYFSIFCIRLKARSPVMPKAVSRR